MQKDIATLREENRLLKNAGHSAGGAGPPAGGVYDDETATV